jgi:hypothetical protein
MAAGLVRLAYCLFAIKSLPHFHIINVFIFFKKVPVSTSFLFNRLSRVLDLCEFRCALPAWPYFNLPNPVTLNRLAAACLVLRGLELFLFLILKEDFDLVEFRK